MAKSMRSKVKRAFRSKKRKSGVYAATEAARLDRLNEKLLQITKTDTIKEAERDSDGQYSCEKGMESPPSTHGPRGSRREEWRKWRGMAVRRGQKAGRAKRRR